jgi:hypothetical protein
MLEELAARLTLVEAELALHRLARQYCVAADHRDVELWRRVWTPDAVWATSPDRVFAGIDVITEAVRAQWEAFPVMQHGTVNHIVDLTGAGTATGRCEVILHVRLADDRWVTGGGTYLDEYRSDGTTWRIARRVVHRPFDLGPFPAWDQTAQD